MNSRRDNPKRWCDSGSETPQDALFCSQCGSVLGVQIFEPGSILSTGSRAGFSQTLVWPTITIVMLVALIFLLADLSSEEEGNRSDSSTVDLVRSEESGSLNGIQSGSEHELSQIREQYNSVANSEVWFARLLRSKFGNTIRFNDHDYKSDELACLPIDITTITLSTRRIGSGLYVEGTLKLDPLPKGYSALNRQRSEYFVILQAYLFSPEGILVWTDDGFPKGESWVSVHGGDRSFILADDYAGRLDGHELLVLAAGDPLKGHGLKSPVLLGAKRVTLN